MEHFRLSEREEVTWTDVAAVGVGAGAGNLASVDYRDLQARLHQVVGASNSDDARADDDRLHIQPRGEWPKPISPGDVSFSGRHRTRTCDPYRVRIVL